MVNGLDVFKEHFRDYEEQYVLIGGSACDLLMDNVGLEFRATKDLDLVLCVEALTEEFVGHFWSFVKKGEYEILERGNGDKCFYRFTKPKNKEYPYMLEILSKTADALGERLPGTIAPLAVNEEIVSLSAILLDDSYYNFIKSLKIKIGDVVLASEKCIIPLKARAWLDLKERRSRGEQIDQRNVKKHKNDIYRLSQLLSEEPLQNVPQSIFDDIMDFTEGVENDSIDLKQIGVDMKVGEICKLLKVVYCSK